MIKFTSNNDFDFDVPSVYLLRDVSKDLEKRASSKSLLKYEKDPKQEDLHIIALGAHSGWPQNRNGDSFLEKDCRKSHSDFVNAGRAVHRHHKNKPSDPKYGNIKASAYNEDMKRIELIVGLDKDKCSDILDQQEKTGNTNWSMAAKVPYDTCTFCGHKAKSDKQRCKHIPSQLGEMNEAGVKCGMINESPRWFEISNVTRPADFIGMSLSKMASLGGIKTSTDFLQLYPDLYVPEDLYISKKAADKRELLHKLSELEKHVEGVARGKGHTAKDLFIKRHAHKINQDKPIDNTSMDELRKMNPSQVLKVLADNGIVFSPEDFSRYLFDKKVSKNQVKGMKTHLPSIFSDMDDDDDAVNNERFDPDSAIGSIPGILKQLIGKLHEGHSLQSGPAVRRMMICISSGDLKPKHKEEQTKESFDKEFAKQYGAYKLAAANYINEQGKLDDDLMLNLVLQNRG